jgi:uncharacterized membrane protein (UPF0127 family)
LSGVRTVFLSPILERPDVRYRLMNESRGVVLATTIEIALDSRSRRRGLLGRAGLAAGSALVIAPCESIHTFFMKFPIDVLFVAKNGTIVRAFANVGAWRLRAAFSAFAAIEFAAGAIDRSGTGRGDRVILESDYPGAEERQS